MVRQGYLRTRVKSGISDSQRDALFAAAMVNLVAIVLSRTGSRLSLEASMERATQLVGTWLGDAIEFELVQRREVECADGTLVQITPYPMPAGGERAPSNQR